MRETLVATFAVIAHNIHTERTWAAKQRLREEQSPRQRFKKGRRNTVFADPEAEEEPPLEPEKPLAGGSSRFLMGLPKEYRRSRHAGASRWPCIPETFASSPGTDHYRLPVQ